jgi:hypothetical protein
MPLSDVVRTGDRFSHVMRNLVDYLLDLTIVLSANHMHFKERLTLRSLGAKVEAFLSDNDVLKYHSTLRF